MKRVLSVFLGGVVLAGLGLENAAAAPQQPWLKWTRNPLTIPLTVQVNNLLAATNGGVSVKIADGVRNQAGLGCGENTNAPALLANLQVRREYTLTVVGTNFTSANLEFSYQPNWTPLTRNGRASQPKTYRLLIDRELSRDNGVAAAATNTCNSYSNSWTLELTERLPANWRMEDGADDPGPAPGDATSAELGPGKSLFTNRIAFCWSVSLGRLMDGTAAGRIGIREGELTRAIYTATNLFYLSGSGVVRDQVDLILKEPGSPVLRQIKAYQTFVDIVEVNTNRTELRFYKPQDVGTATNSLGHYTSFTTNSAFVIYALLNPAAATTTQLNIQESRNGTTFTNELVFDAASTTETWTLKYGSGAQQRVEKRGVAITSSNRVEVVDIRYNGAASPAYRAKETYHAFPWGLELIETRIDPDDNTGTANDLVTAMAFNTNTGEPHSYGKVDTIFYPDGFWEKRIYDDTYWYAYGTLKHVLHPERDSTTNDLASFPSSFTAKVTSYEYEPDAGLVSVFGVSGIKKY